MKPARLGAAALRARWPLAALVGAGAAAVGALLLSAATPAWQRDADADRAAADASRRQVLARGRSARALPPTTPAQRFRAAFPPARARGERVAALLDGARRHGLAPSASEFALQVDPSLELAALGIDLPLVGPYGALRAFVDEALAADPALALDRLRLRRGDASEVSLRADLHFTLYMAADADLAMPGTGARP